MKINNLLDNIESEINLNSKYLHLTANEAQMSETARRFLGSKISERYYFGAGKNNIVESGSFIGLGLPAVEELVLAAEEATKRMVGAAVVNLNCLSGVHAMMCAIESSTELGDTIMTVHHDHGGHFATEGIIQRVGRKHVFASYNIDKLAFDTEKMASDFKRTNAKALYLDVSYYINPHNLREIRQALGEDAIIIYDASHTMGLIMGQQFQSPLKEGANVMCANTHKTLPGPQKGMVTFRDKDFGEKASGIINACLYSSPHTQSMIALATTILEMEEYGQEYAKQVIANSNAIAQAFFDLGYDVRKANTGRWSENHQAHVFIDNKGEKIELYSRLVKNLISTNFDDVLGGRTFIRIGTQEVTRRGMKETEMKMIAELVNKAFSGLDVTKEVTDLNFSYQTIKYSFD